MEKKPPRTRVSHRQVSLRLSRDLIEELRIESIQKGITFAHLLRSILQDRQLRGSKLEEARELIRRTRSEVKGLRWELALLAEVLLIHAANMPKEEVRDWVKQTFGKEV